MYFGAGALHFISRFASCYSDERGLPIADGLLTAVLTLSPWTEAHEVRVVEVSPQYDESSSSPARLYVDDAGYLLRRPPPLETKPSRESSFPHSTSLIKSSSSPAYFCM